MELEKLKRRLGIEAEDTSQDEELAELLEEAIAFVEQNCGGKQIAELPATTNRIIAKYVQYDLNCSAGVLSESIGGMSQTFESSADRNASLLSELSAMGLRRLRFIPFGGR